MNARMKNLFDRLGQYAFLTSSLGGKYVVGIATAGSFGAKKVARQLAAGVQKSVFRRGYVSGTLGLHLRGKHASTFPKALHAAASLGRRLAADIRARRTFPLQDVVRKTSERARHASPDPQGNPEEQDAMPGVHRELVRLGVIPGA